MVAGPAVGGVADGEAVAAGVAVVGQGEEVLLTPYSRLTWAG